MLIQLPIEKMSHGAKLKRMSLDIICLSVVEVPKQRLLPESVLADTRFLVVVAAD